nr:hypothetical protein [Tanacetum cinerariifolium]
MSLIRLQSDTLQVHIAALQADLQATKGLIQDGRNGDGGTNLAKITKKWPKPDKIEHEIEKIAQKPDPKTFSVY